MAVWSSYTGHYIHAYHSNARTAFAHLTPAHEVRVGGQHIDHLAFALVAPLGAQDDGHFVGVGTVDGHVRRECKIMNWKTARRKRLPDGGPSTRLTFFGDCCLVERSVCARTGKKKITDGPDHGSRRQRRGIMQ